MIKTNMGWPEWGLLGFLSILWGSAFFFVEIALESVPPLTLVALRLSLACLVLWCIIWGLRLQVPKNGQAWGRFLIMGLLNNALPFSFLTFAQLYIASSLTAVLTATAPLFGVLLAALFLKDEPAAFHKIFGVVFGFLGVGLIIGPELFIPGGGDANLSAALAQMGCLLAAFCYACASVYGRRLPNFGVSPLCAAAGQLTMSSSLLWPFVLFFEASSFEVNALNFALLWQGLAAIGILALASSALAYVIYFKLLARIGATNLLLVTFLIPVTALLLGVFILSESLGLSDLAGMGLIALGLSAVDGRLWRFLFAGRG